MNTVKSTLAIKLQISNCELDHIVQSIRETWSIPVRALTGWIDTWLALKRVMSFIQAGCVPASDYWRWSHCQRWKVRRRIEKPQHLICFRGMCKANSSSLIVAVTFLNQQYAMVCQTIISLLKIELPFKTANQWFGFPGSTTAWLVEMGNSILKTYGRVTVSLMMTWWWFLHLCLPGHLGFREPTKQNQGSAFVVSWDFENVKTNVKEDGTIHNELLRRR